MASRFLWCVLACFKLRYSKDSVQGKKSLKPLAGGYSATLWALVGDLEYLNSCLKLPHYSSKSNPCALCRCTGDSEDPAASDDNEDMTNP